MYGYNDYHGPFWNERRKKELTSLVEQPVPEEDNSEDDETDPLRPGLWMEGDSLAPPCGCSIDVIHEMLVLANVTESDVLYDLGAGDGRVCLEAFVHRRCHSSVGIEIEPILIQRFQHLIQDLTTTLAEDNTNGTTNSTTPVPHIVAYQGDLRQVLTSLVHKNNNHFIVVPTATTTSTSTTSQTLLPNPTVITLYLLPEAIQEIEPLLIELLRQHKALRILCNTWGLPTLQPYRTKNVNGTTLYLYTDQCLTQLK